MGIVERVTSLLFQGSDRTIKAKKNIIYSFLLKILSIVISLQIVPLTIHYINPTRYGIWLTLSSLICWFSFFDIGLSNGFRNKFAEAKARGKYKLARIYVSTTYATLFLIFLVFIVVVSSLAQYIDWTSVLKIDLSYKEELNNVFKIVSIFWGINMIASIFTTMITADQKPALSSLIQVLGQLLAYVTIFLLTKFTIGNLTYLAFVFSGIPIIVLIMFSIWFYSTKYKNYKPSIKLVRFSFIKPLLGLGGKFFIITMSSLVIFQLMNIIISRLEGPDVVTEYNIAYKYFNVLFMVAIIILTPFWSAFTDAFSKKDYVWMKNTMHKLEKLWLLCIPLNILMVVCADFFYNYWIGDSVSISLSMNIAVSLFMLCQTLGGVYMYLINGIGKVRLQLLIYLFFSIFSFPTMYYMCQLYGIQGLLLVPTFVYIVQAIVSRIQLIKIISERQKGIWDE